MVEIYGHIYKIENLLNGKVYIGQSTRVHKRKLDHFATLDTNKHHNEHLQNAFNKYGKSNFKFTVLNYATDKKTLDKLEQDYIHYYNCVNRSQGYNLQTGGANGKHSLESRKKISETHKGKNNPMYGKRGPLAPNYGKKFSEETCRMIGEGHKGMRPHNFGKPLSKEARENLSKKHLIKNQSPLARKKMSEAQKGRGLFNFTGSSFVKRNNPEKKCWYCRITYHSYHQSLGMYEDPLSAEIVHDLVLNEIFK